MLGKPMIINWFLKRFYANPRNCSGEKKKTTPEKASRFLFLVLKVMKQIINFVSKICLMMILPSHSSVANTVNSQALPYSM